MHVGNGGDTPTTTAAIIISEPSLILLPQHQQHQQLESHALQALSPKRNDSVAPSARKLHFTSKAASSDEEEGETGEGTLAGFDSPRRKLLMKEFDETLMERISSPEKRKEKARRLSTMMGKYSSMEHLGTNGSSSSNRHHISDENYSVTSNGSPSESSWSANDDENGSPSSVERPRSTTNELRILAQSIEVQKKIIKDFESKLARETEKRIDFEEKLKVKDYEWKSKELEFEAIRMDFEESKRNNKHIEGEMEELRERQRELEGLENELVALKSENVELKRECVFLRAQLKEQMDVQHLRESRDGTREREMKRQIEQQMGEIERLKRELEEKEDEVRSIQRSFASERAAMEKRAEAERQKGEAEAKRSLEHLKRHFEIEIEQRTLERVNEEQRIQQRRLEEEREQVERWKRKAEELALQAVEREKNANATRRQKEEVEEEEEEEWILRRRREAGSQEKETKANSNNAESHDQDLVRRKPVVVPRRSKGERRPVVVHFGKNGSGGQSSEALVSVLFLFLVVMFCILWADVKARGPWIPWLPPS